MVDVGDAFVLPGFIDMHNHLAYNTLPLWVEPGRTEPWLHNKHWPDADTYTESITEPAWVYAKACPEALLGVRPGAGDGGRGHRGAGLADCEPRLPHGDAQRRLARTREPAATT